MRTDNCIRIIILILIFFCCNVSIAFAMTTDFKTEALSKEVESRFLENTKVKVSNTEYKGMMFTTFDVSEGGDIALGDLSDFKGGLISVYDKDGNFRRMFSFQSAGEFHVKWVGDNLLVFFVRGYYIGRMSMEGKWLEVRRIPENVAKEKWMQLTNESIKTVGGVQYYKKNNAFMNFIEVSYSQLVKKEVNGNEIILYDNSVIKNRDTIIGFTVATLLTIFAVFVVIRIYRRKSDTI